jgi:hypothetical protein
MNNSATGTKGLTPEPFQTTRLNPHGELLFNKPVKKEDKMKSKLEKRSSNGYGLNELFLLPAVSVCHSVM